uniref:Carbohydrate kinase PfkB domain-containing protein n=1 Tax=Chromera velia CCMP2878 TaxID=1169474 RepID=A0A0G4GRG1_9ALVE|eukprot:Cvel_23059.t1-p1 / transcript=Cvel_23059.t1 / gene=Cvel_23059 / organism=Chromera_velia_CCMP2878 / gene_product=hypothetical protein / transcript_product=hypothetical protein / location=Cvel_scaffold2334:9400-13779(+) / protein_length=371 / sequence_SO=supercontig / SO=protein_coding / is_pseudo=false
MQAGGSATNTTVHLASLAASPLPCELSEEWEVAVAERAKSLKLGVNMHGAFGADGFGQSVRKRLAEVGLSDGVCEVGPSSSSSSSTSTKDEDFEVFGPAYTDAGTGVCLCLGHEGDRGFISYYGSTSVWKEKDVNVPKLSQANHVHVTGLYNMATLLPQFAELLGQIRDQSPPERGLTISLDTAFDSSEDWAHITEILPLVDFFMPNEVELVAVAEAGGGCNQSEGGSVTFIEEEAIRYCFDQVKVGVVAKKGHRGATALWNCPPMESGGPERVLKVECSSLFLAAEDLVDTTGAGDSFNAGFLYVYSLFAQQKDSRLEKWLPLAMQFGCVCGFHAVQKVGGCMHPAKLADLFAELKTQGLPVTVTMEYVR